MKKEAEHNLVSDMKRDIPKFDTVLLHSYPAAYDENS